MARKFIHSGTGPAVRCSRTGWSLAPGDKPKGLPPGGSAEIIEAVRTGVLIEAPAAPVPPQSPVAPAQPAAPESATGGEPSGDPAPPPKRGKNRNTETE